MTLAVRSEAILVIADILSTWMDLNPGQVMLAYQKYNIPTNGLLIILSAVNDQMISGESYLQDDGNGGQEEVGQVLMLSELQIDALSYDDEARQRRFEIPMSVQSPYSEAQQEIQNLQIAKNIMPMQDTSFLEVTKYLSRYTTRIRVTWMQTIVHDNAVYNDSFTGEFYPDANGQTKPILPTQTPPTNPFIP